MELEESMDKYENRREIRVAQWLEGLGQKLQSVGCSPEKTQNTIWILHEILTAPKERRELLMQQFWGDKVKFGDTEYMDTIYNYFKGRLKKTKHKHFEILKAKIGDTDNTVILDILHDIEDAMNTEDEEIRIKKKMGIWEITQHAGYFISNRERILISNYLTGGKA